MLLQAQNNTKIITYADDLAEDDMAAIEPGGGDSGDEELRAVRVGAGVGHAEDAGASVLKLEVLQNINSAQRSSQ